MKHTTYTCDLCDDVMDPPRRVTLQSRDLDVCDPCLDALKHMQLDRVAWASSKDAAVTRIAAEKKRAADEDLARIDAASEAKVDG